jgi:hypothetical protein
MLCKLGISAEAVADECFWGGMVQARTAYACKPDDRMPHVQNDQKQEEKQK